MKTQAKVGRSLQLEYQNVFRNALIRPVAEGTAKVVLAHPARAFAGGEALLPPGVTVTHRAAPLLAESNLKGFYVRSAAWPEEGFHATRFTMLMCVLEGETDFRIGVTEGAAREHSLDAKFGQQVWTLPANTLCVVPPGVPFDDGNRPHWCRPDVENARSQLHWIHLIPAGALIHSCRTVGPRHEMVPYLYVRDSSLALQGELLEQTMAGDSPRAAEITQSRLLALLWSIEQQIDSAQSSGMRLTEGLDERREPAGAVPGESTGVRRAQQFILGHLHDPLTVESIAASAYGSASWLNRQFQAELGMSIMHYVTQVRINEARMLLADTDLPVTEIGKIVGFPDPSYFSQVFTRWEKMSPNRFRKNSG